MNYDTNYKKIVEINSHSTQTDPVKIKDLMSENEKEEKLRK